jgi:thiamine-phosphate pyrophosphorylase
MEMGQTVKRLCNKAGIPFIVNDRVDIALAIDADGVHLGADDMPVKDARRLMGADKVIGASAGTIEEALTAKEEGANYLGVGSIYATATKADAGEPIGPEALQKIKSAAMMPIVGIGGISHHNAAPVIAAGADGIAVISAVVSAPDIAAAVRSLKEIVIRVKRQRQ